MRAAGGGRVVVPAGTFLTGAIHLKSSVNLHLSAGATLRFSRNPQDYLPVVFTRWEGVELMNYSPFIYAFEQENIAITGAARSTARRTRSTGGRGRATAGAERRRPAGRRAHG